MKGSQPPSPPPGSPPSGNFGAADAFAFLASRRTPEPPRQSLTNAVHFKAADAMRARRNPQSIDNAVRAAWREADAAWAQARPEIEARRQPEFACKSGCSWCCHQQVSLAPAEAVTIARHVMAKFTAEQLTALRARLKALDDKTRGLGVWGRARLKEPCAFLVNGACSIYEVRPLRCRGLYSRDAEHCHWVMDNPDQIYSAGGKHQHGNPGPYPVEPLQMVELAMTGLARALNEVGLDYEASELTAAMRIALDMRDVANQYAARAPVFVPARLPERDDVAGAAKP